MFICLRVLVFLLFLTGAALANGPLRSIVVFGNDKTERATILNLAGVEEQAYVNNRLVDDVDARLVTSGLFKTVHVMKVDNPDGTSDLRINVVEKQLWFAFPTFQAWSGRYSGGAVFGESNLFLPNARTLFLIEGGNKSGRFFSVIDAKNIFDSSFAGRTWVLARSDDVGIYEDGERVDEITMKDAAIALTPGYQWTNDIRTSGTFQYRYVKYGESPRVALSGETGSDISIEFEFLHDSLRRREAFLDGSRLEASYEFADTRFGTDFSYHIEKVNWHYARRVYRYFNYVLETEGAIGDTLPFHRELTLGGASLRGYSDRQFRGDTRIVARQDLLFALFRHSKFSVFGTLFYDAGLLYFEQDGLSRDSLRNGAGAGIRVSLADILAPVFGLDAGYGIDEKNFSLYLALGLVDF